MDGRLVSVLHRAYEVEVAIAASEELVDLAAEGFGVDMRLTPPIRFVIVGSPAYLARSGRPERTEDLRHHACPRLRRSSRAPALWPLNDDGRAVEVAVSGPLIANDFPALPGGAIEGMGLAQVPEPIAARPVTAGQLVHVLERFAVRIHDAGCVSLLSRPQASNAGNKTRIPELEAQLIEKWPVEP